MKQYLFYIMTIQKGFDKHTHSGIYSADSKETHQMIYKNLLFQVAKQIKAKPEEVATLFYHIGVNSQ